MIEINRDPTRRELRWFGLLQFVFFGLIVRWLAYPHNPGPILWGLLGVSLVVAMVGLAAPANLRPLYVAWMTAVFPIGWVVSHVLLGAIFYLVITPLGCMMRLRGHDPMQRRIDKSAATYWVARPPAPAPKNYFRQF